MIFPESKWLKVVNAGSDTQPAEILIDDVIGKSYWDDSGVGERDFKAALAMIPKGRKIVLGINSEGGSVKDGLGMYHAIRARKDDVTCRNDGCAWSIASVLLVAGGRTICPKASTVMIHDPWTYCQGNADEMRRAADGLDANAKALVAAYAEKTGKSETEIRDAMKREAWFTGEEAKAWGISDDVTDEPVTVASNKTFQRSQARMPSHVLNLIRASAKPIASPPEEQNKADKPMKLLLAALAGAKLIPAAENITDEQASTTVVAALAKRDSDLSTLSASLATERTARETAESSLATTRKALAEMAVEADVKAGRLKDDATLRAKWVDAYTKDFDGTKAMAAGFADAKPAPTASGVPLDTVKGAKEHVDRDKVIAEFNAITDAGKRAKFYAENKAILLG
jgi:ATP-dependent Clp endopeptidase proteolytic subunit ClpP